MTLLLAIIYALISANLQEEGSSSWQPGAMQAMACSGNRGLSIRLPIHADVRDGSSGFDAHFHTRKVILRSIFTRMAS